MHRSPRVAKDGTITVTTTTGSSSSTTTAAASTSASTSAATTTGATTTAATTSAAASTSVASTSLASTSVASTFAATTTAASTSIASTAAAITSAGTTSSATTSAASTTVATSTGAASTSLATTSAASTSALSTSTSSTAAASTNAASTTAATTSAVSSTSAASTSAASTSTAAAASASTTAASTSAASTLSASTAAASTSAASTSAASTTSVLSTQQATTLAGVTGSTSTTSFAVTTTVAATTTHAASTSAVTTSDASTSFASTSAASTSAASTAAASTSAAATSSASTAAASSTSVAFTSAASTSAASATSASTSAASVSAATSSVASTQAASTSLASTNAAATSSAASTSAVSASVSTSVVETTTVASSTTVSAFSASSLAASTSAASTLAVSTSASVSTSAVSTTATTSSFASTVGASTSADASTAAVSASTSSLLSLSTSALTLTTSVAATSGSTGPGALSPPPSVSTPPQAMVSYYNVTSFLLPTRRISDDTQNFLPLVREDVAIFVLHSGGVPLYVRPSDCSSGSCCNATTVAPCGPSASAGCIDAVNPRNRSAGYGQSVYYELTITSACQNVLIELEVLSGDADLYARAGAPPDALAEDCPYYSSGAGYDWSSTNPASDSLSFCCDPREGNTPTPFPGPAAGSVDSLERQRRRTLANVLAGNAVLYLQVLSWSSSARWQLRVTEGSPALLPLATHHWMLTQPRLTCGGAPACYASPHGDDVAYPCLLFPVPSADALDPYSAWQIGAVDGTGFGAELLPDQVSFALYVSLAAAGQQAPQVILDNCTLSLPDVLDSTGAVLFPFPLPVQPAPALPCDRAAFAGVVATFLNFSGSVLTPPADVQADLVQEVGAAVSSRSWGACSAFARALLSSASLSSKRAGTTTTGASNYTTACTAVRGTAEYLADPCCNPLLLLQECCAPRPAVPLSFVANSSAIGAQCRTPQCSAAAVSQLGLFLQLRTDPDVGCDAQTLTATRYFGLAPNPVSIAAGGGCASFLKWEVGTSPYDAALTACVLHSLESTSFLLVAFSSIIFNLSTSAFPSESAFLAAFETAFSQRYASRSICRISGVPFNSLGDQLRSVALDADAAACLAAPTCNWDTTRTNASCQGQGYRAAGFCGYCDSRQPGWCHEVSDPRGCSIRSDVYSEGLAAYCATVGGVLMVEEPLDGDSRGQTCYLPAAANQSACIDPSTCRVSLSFSAPPSTLCPAGCALPTFNVSTCGCYPLPADLLLATECSYLTWDASTGRCWHDGVVTSGDCQARGGLLLGNREWHDGYLDTPASCAAAGGLCLEDLSLSAAQCSGQCDVCPSCADAAACQATTACSDLLSGIPAGGACILAPVLGRIDLAPQCAQPAFLTPLGCADPTITQSLCSFLNLTWYTPVGANLQLCGHAEGCSELRNGFSLANSYRRPAECAQCGGSSYSLFDNVTGTWTPYTWQPLAWVQRAYAPASDYGPAFDTSLFSSDFDTVTNTLEYGALKSHILCEYSQPAQLVTQLACDCGASAGAGAPSPASCYPTLQGTLVSLQRACSGTASNFTAANAVLSLPNTTSFADGCTEIAFYQLPADSFAAPPTLRSSLFLASLAKGPFSIVRNSGGVQIGQLAGNGLQLVAQDSEGITLCLDLRSDLGALDPSFTVPDFATCDASFDITSFRPLLLPSAAALAGAGSSQICTTLPLPVSNIYFPIYRTTDTSVGFFASLSASQRGAFYAALVIYLLVALLAYYRLVSVLAYSFLVSRMVMLIGIWAMASVILTLRWIYFALVIGGLVSTGSAADYILSELPTTLFFSLFSLIVLFWAMLYHATIRVRGDFRRPMLVAFALANSLLYVFLLVVIGVYVHSSNSATTTTSCGQTSGSDVAAVLSKAYKITLSAIVLALGVAFLVYGIQLGRVLAKMKSSADAQSKFRKLTTVAVVFPLALVLQCTLLLYATFGSPLNTGVGLFLLILVEIAPLLVLSWNISLPVIFHSPLQDVLWCFFDYQEGLRSQSTANSSSHGEIVSGGPGSVASYYPDDGQSRRGTARERSPSGYEFAVRTPRENQAET